MTIELNDNEVELLKILYYMLMYYLIFNLIISLRY
jgi:hypothetical protein